MSLLNHSSVMRRMSEGVYIRGIGYHSAVCLYQLELQSVQVKGFLTMNPRIEMFRGIRVFDVSKEVSNDSFIVVATSESVYEEISNELRLIGKKEFIDFAYYSWLTKDLVLLHGNCHMAIIRTYLQSSNSFQDQFAIYPYPLLLPITKEFRTEKEIFSYMDYWIHEDIRDDNMFGYKVSDSYIRSCVGKNTKEIIIPHLYGIGHILYPQSVPIKHGNEALNNGIDTDGMFLYGDSVIEKCLDEGMKISEIVKYCYGECIDKSEIIENFQRCLDKLASREKQGNWDIKIYDFIYEKYKTAKLFYDEGHPTNIIFKYICSEILKILGIEEKQIYCNDILDLQELFVYPVVKSTLGLDWNENEIRHKGRKLAAHMNFTEYVKEYIWWRHLDIFEVVNDID